MSENPENEKETQQSRLNSDGKNLLDRIPFWIGVLGSLITVVLTVYNSYTKSSIDKSESRLKELEAEYKKRSVSVEESKERVERYKWVLSLFPALNVKDKDEKTFTINLMRLALTDSEAAKLFAGLQASSDTSLQSVGRNGVTALETEPIALLVSQMNASSSDVRKSAVSVLVRDYKSSSIAIMLTLRMYEKNKIETLSPSGVINGLYYLSSTDPLAWSKPQLLIGREVLSRLENNSPGKQTTEALNAFKALLLKATQN